MTDHKKDFIKLFNRTAGYVDRYQLFSDFIDCTTGAIHNRFVYCEYLEEKYLECVKRYKPEDMMNMSLLLSEIVMGLEQKFCDFLGEIYMELALGNKWRGQVFTPYHVSQLCAQLNYGDQFQELGDKPFVTVQEPACGSGSMIIAFAETMLKAGHNPQEKMWAQCVDVDTRCAQMTFIQLSLLGIPAKITVGNSLSGEVSRTMYTSGYYLFGWSTKLKQYRGQLKEPQQHQQQDRKANQLTLFDFDLAS